MTTVSYFVASSPIGAQLLLRQADPRRVVGVRVDDGRHVAGGEVALDLRADFLAPEVVDVERLRGDAEDAHLTALHGESGVDEENLVFGRVELRAHQERGEAALHRPDGRDASFGGDLHAEKGFEEARSLLFQLRDALHGGVARRDALLQGRAFGFDAHALGRQSRHAHFEVEELGAGFALHHAGDVARLADRGLRDVRDVHPLQCGAQTGSVEGYLHHRFVCFRVASQPARNAARFTSTTCSPLRAKMSRMPASSRSVPMPSIGAAAPSSTMLAERGDARGPGQGVGIERHRVRQGVQFALQGLGVGVVGDVDHRNRVGDDPSVGRQPRQVAQRLHRFERDDEVGLAPRDEVRMDRRRGDAQVRLHVAAPLAHAVDLGLLQLQPFGEGRPSDDGGDGEDALSSDS